MKKQKPKPATIGQRIRELRQARGRKLHAQLAKRVPAVALKPPEDQYTQADLARDCGCRQDQICLWERGVKVPSPGSLAKLARVLEVSLDELISE